MPDSLPAAKELDRTNGKNWDAVQTLPCLLTLDVSMPDFTIGNLLALEKGSIINSHWKQVSDIPFRINGEIVGWSEFEVANKRLAVRVTELE